MPTDPVNSVNSRSPSLDLDSVYGAGPVASPQLHPADRDKLRIGFGGLFEDLPRLDDGTNMAIVADPRNDEQMMIFGQAMTDDVLRNGRRFYRPRMREGFIPVEFQAGAYRFGHSMVRPSYRANLAGDAGNPFFAMVFDPAGEGQPDPVDLRGGARAPRRFIGWQTLWGAKTRVAAAQGADLQAEPN
jgi:hypothetical protein